MRNLEKDEIEMKARRAAMLDNGFRLFAAKGIESVAMRYAQGLLYAAECEEDRTEEYELLKRMILREYVRA